MTLQTETPQEMQEWMDKLQETIANLLNQVTSVKEMVSGLRSFRLCVQKAVAHEKTPEQEWRLIQKESEGNLVCADCNAQGEEISLKFRNRNRS